MKNPLFSFSIIPSSGSLLIFKYQYLCHFKKDNLKETPCSIGFNSIFVSNLNVINIPILKLNVVYNFVQRGIYTSQFR